MAGCIPVRISGERPEDVSVLLISSRGGKGYCFPKGGWEDDETVEAAAKRETVEEAGVRGCLEEPIVGAFAFSSGKPDTTSRHNGKCIASIFVMHVEEELEVWPEGHERKRFWCPLAEASDSIRYDWMRQALLVWIQRKGWSDVVVQVQQKLLPQIPDQDGSGAAASGAPGILTAGPCVQLDAVVSELSESCSSP